MDKRTGKKGRPQKAIKRPWRLSVRMTDAEYELASKHAEEQGLPLSTYMRMLSLKRIKPLSREARELISSV